MYWVSRTEYTFEGEHSIILGDFLKKVLYKVMFKNVIKTKNQLYKGEKSL